MASLKYKTQNGYEPIPAQVVTKTNAQQGNGIGTCSTSSGTALAVTLANYELVLNGFIAVTFEHDVPASATLNVNGKGAKPIIYKGNAIEDNVIKEDDTVTFCYDGTNYVVTSLGGSGATQEFVVISLKTDNDTDSALTGATIVVTDDNTSETILSTTWSGTDVIVGVDGGVEYTITVGEVQDYDTHNTQSYIAIAGLTRTVRFVYSPDVYVDLGLPSGIKWAKKNIGATHDYDIGFYFQWGDIIGYEKDTSYIFNTTNYSTTPGYTLTGNIPTNASYDAAVAIKGGSWRMPTSTEFQELLDNTDCEFVTSYLGTGQNGYKFMKKTDHNIFVFLPATGHYNGNTLNNYNDTTLIWTSSYNSNTHCYFAWIRQTSQVISAMGNRESGLVIRAVR